MKRFFSILLLLALTLCFAACSGEGNESTAPTGGTKYKLVSIQMEEGGYMGQQTLEEASGGDDLYVVLYDDGTAKLRIQPGAPTDMVYNETAMWRVDSPDVTAQYEIEGKELTIRDYPFVYTFQLEK